MKSFISIILLMLCIASLSNKAFACDDASATLISAINNGDGTYTYTIEVCAEYNGLEGNPDNLLFDFGGIAINSYTPASYSTTGGDVYTPSLISGGTVLEYATGSVFIVQSAATCCLCNTFSITTTGFSTNVDIQTNDYPSAICTISMALPDFSGGCVGNPAFVGY